MSACSWGAGLGWIFDQAAGSPGRRGAQDKLLRGATEVLEVSSGLRGGLGGVAASLAGPSGGWPSGGLEFCSFADPLPAGGASKGHSGQHPRDATQVQPEVGNVASGPGGAQQWGRLQLSLEYDYWKPGGEGVPEEVWDFGGVTGEGSVPSAGWRRADRGGTPGSQIRVGLQQAVELRPGALGGTTDPYAHLSLSLDARRMHETKVPCCRLCPVFEQTCSFHMVLGWARGPGRGGSHPSRRCRLRSCPGPPCKCCSWTTGASPSTGRWASSACCWAPWIWGGC